MIIGNGDNICPCKYCPDAGCGSYHDICERYQKWKGKLNQTHQIARQESINKDVMSDAQKKHCWRKKRYGRNQPISRSTKER